MTTDEGRELLCNIQGTIAARLIAISLARFAAGGSTNHINFSAIFSPDLPFLSTACRKWPGHRHPPVLRIAKYPGLGTRKFDQMRIKICFSPIKPLQILQ